MTNAPLSGANLRGALDLSSLVRPPVTTGAGTSGAGSPGAGTPGAGGARGPGGPPSAGTPGSIGGVIRASTDATFAEILDLSSIVPVVVEFHGQSVEPALGRIVEQYGGRIALATVDTATNPQLVQAFKVDQIPMVAAVVGGQPIQLFAGLLSELEVREVFEQLLQVAAQQGVTGTIDVSSPDDVVEPVDEPLPPHHQEAYDAIVAGNFTAAIAEYETAIAQNPRDQLAVAGLAQVSLLARLDGQSAEQVRSAAASDSTNVAAQLAVADLDVSGGHLESAFSRLLDLFSTLDIAEKAAVRTRLIQYFEIAGADEPRVISARRRLTGLLY